MSENKVHAICGVFAVKGKVVLSHSTSFWALAGSQRRPLGQMATAVHVERDDRDGLVVQLDTNNSLENPALSLLSRLTSELFSFQTFSHRTAV